MEEHVVNKVRAAMLLAGTVLAVLALLVVALIYVQRMLVYNPNGWVTVAGIGSQQADPLTRAVIARIGLFANSPDKALYFSAYAKRDIGFRQLLRGPSEVFALEPDAHYRIRGDVQLPARWWSIALYDASDRLVESAEKRYSYTNFDLAADKQGRFVLDIAAVRPPGATNWMPAPTDGRYTLKMRIYEPSSAIHESVASFPLPRLERVSP